jgi:hypothetical protein
MTMRRNGKAPSKRKPRARTRATKAQLAARKRLLREAERRTGVKITKAQVAAFAAEVDKALGN